MRLILTVLLFASAPMAIAAAPDDVSAQFFESRIRPILAERCYSCHSSSAKKLKADLFLDSRQGLIKGGESGTALIPGHPEQSRLIEAIEYKNVDLQMPPKDKLSDQQIADLTKWVTEGAVWPGEKTVAVPAAVSGGFNLQQRKQDHWAWQLVQPVEPPAVKNSAWPHDPVDRFILAKLESQSMVPATPADRRTLLRRVTFDLIGLPPTPQEVETFLADSSPNAMEKVVDRLLASPCFGERWARHWLDLARYAETLGHEFDFVLPNAFRYRDYVIRAFNAGVPYNQFLLEQLAGDLLTKPRTNPVDGSNESIIGTGFLYLGESVHSPVDARQNQADLIDNRIDVTGKAILGLTVACARCHDHKFDAIAAADYYAMYGMFESTRYAQVLINRDAIATKATQLEKVQDCIRAEAAKQWQPKAAQVGAYLLASRRVLAGENETAIATQEKLDPALLSKWHAALADPVALDGSHPFHAWVKQAFPQRKAIAREVIAPPERDGDIELAHFSSNTFGDWAPDGLAFGTGPSRPGDFLISESAKTPIASISSGGVATSNRISRRLEGTLRSPSFVIDRDHLLVHGAGNDTRINLCIEGLNILRAPIYGGTKKVLKQEKASWIAFNLEMWKGRRAYLELADNSVPDEGDTAHGPAGWISVDRIVMTDDPKPPAYLPPTAAPLFSRGKAAASVEALADRYQKVISETIEAWGAGSLATMPDAPARAALLNGLLERGLLNGGGLDSPAMASLFAEAKRLEASLPAPLYAPGAADGNGIDEHVFIRGSHHNLGQQVPRRSLEALGGSAAASKGSGRLEFAQHLVEPSNPLVSRVIVNRVWHHLFGRGIVASTDNFGVLGEKPSDPQLLDYLAVRFVSEGWSIKRLIRELVLSSTYQMSSRGDPKFDEIDPDNRLLHRMNLRRMEGEMIRDQMLALSGRLDLTMFGPSVDVHLTAFMEGRGRPASGPLDGAGRRSIYTGVRRNFLSPMLLAFDTPIPFSAMGRRSISNVPAQALILMNDPFVVAQARLWAEKVMANPSPTDRVTAMYQSAFCRPPTATESASAIRFVQQQAAAWSGASSPSADDPRAWADLAHVLMNLKEFIFVN